MSSAVRSQWLGVPALSILVIALFGYLDYTTGPDFGFSLFYLVPVMVSAWSAGPIAGATAACLAGVTWFLADVPWHGLNAISLWNAATRLAMYVVIAALMARVRSDRDALSNLNIELRHLLEREQQLARTDPLTGLPNARAFFDALQRAIESSRRSGNVFSLAYLDLNDFKSINDRFGHPTGDRVLKVVADHLAAAVRKGDLVARLGGDEFTILFSDADPVRLGSACERIQRDIAGVSRDYPGTRLGVSIGVAQAGPDTTDAADAVRRADEAMYRTKRAPHAAAT